MREFRQGGSRTCRPFGGRRRTCGRFGRAARTHAGVLAHRCQNGAKCARPRGPSGLPPGNGMQNPCSEAYAVASVGGGARGAAHVRPFWRKGRARAGLLAARCQNPRMCAARLGFRQSPRYPGPSPRLGGRGGSGARIDSGGCAAPDRGQHRLRDGGRGGSWVRADPARAAAADRGVRADHPGVPAAADRGSAPIRGVPVVADRGSAPIRPGQPRQIGGSALKSGFPRALPWANRGVRTFRKTTARF